MRKHRPETRVALRAHRHLGRANESARAEGDTVTLAVGIDAYRERRATVARVAASAKNEPITATMKSAHGA